MNHFVDALRKYVDFSGRATRTQFWWFLLVATVISIVLSILDSQLGTALEGPGLEGGLLSGLFSLAIFLPSLALLVRRIHDTGRTGWWALLLLIPCVGLIAWLVFGLQASENGDNQWGPYPHTR